MLFVLKSAREQWVVDINAGTGVEMNAILKNVKN